MNKTAEKPERNRRIIEWHDKKHKSFITIGREFKISRQRAYQIYIREKAKALKK